VTNRIIVLLRGLSIALAFVTSASSQTAVVPPSVRPPGITSGVPTVVTVSSLVVSSGPQVLPNSVNLLQVDENGNNARVIGTLNDDGINGDLIAGDGIFGGSVTMSPEYPGEVYIQVSAAFRGLLRRELSPVVPVLVTPPGMPNTPRPMNLGRTATDPQSGAAIICDELLLTFDQGAIQSDISSVIQSVGGTLAGMLPQLGVYQITFPTCDAASLNTVLIALTANPLVSSASYDAVVTLAQETSIPNDPYFRDGSQWSLTTINALGAWSLAQAYGVTEGATVAVLDTGVNPNHEDLIGEVQPGINWCASLYPNGTCEVRIDAISTDDFGHGTAVAGLAAAITDNGLGVASPAYKAAIVPEKVTAPSGQSTLATIAAAIYDAVSRGARVINISSAGPLPWPQAQKVVEDAQNKMAVVVASAGNSFANDIPYYPAAYPGVIAVGASDQNDQIAVWKNSNGSFCDSQNKGSNYGPWITLYAPGSEMLTLYYKDVSGPSAYGYISGSKSGEVAKANPDPCYGDGTSFAAPLVAGTASLLLALKSKITPGSTLKPSDLTQILSCSADIVRQSNGSLASSINRLDMYRAAQVVASGRTSCAGLTGTASVQATLDGSPWSGSAGYTLACSSQSFNETAVPNMISDAPAGPCTISDFVGGPPNSILSSVSPAVSQTLAPVGTIAFTLNYVSNPPTAGFVMSSGSQSATNGQTLTVSVPSGSSATVAFDAASRSSAVNGATMTGWQWTVDNVVAATTSAFEDLLPTGTHAVSLVVTDSRGAQSQSVSGTVVVASPMWTQLTTSSASVPGREAPSAVYDPSTNRVILFGGVAVGPFCCNNTYNEVWVLTNANGLGGTPAWTHLTPSGTSGFPASRDFASAVYDTATNRMIVFGGGQPGTAGVYSPLFNDTWVLTNANGIGGTPAWLPLSPVGGPPAPREGHRAVYDAQSNRMTVFGGGNNGVDDMNDTWVLTNANGLGGTPTWTQLSPTGITPSGRENFAAGYDPSTDRLTIFGGCCYWTNDTWVLTNANGLGGTPQWIQLSPTGTLPAIRSTPAFGYDPTDNFLLIFGMLGPPPVNNVFYNDSWELLNANGAAGTPEWVNLIANDAPNSPPIIPGFNTAAASSYDITNQRLILLRNAPVSGGGSVLQTWVLALQ
jgi:hypothetical protein